MGLPLKEAASCWQETDFRACNKWQRNCSADGEGDCITVQLGTVHRFLASKTANFCSHEEPHWSWLIKPCKWNYISGITHRHDSCSQQWVFARLGPVTIGWIECCTSEISKGVLGVWFRSHKTTDDVHKASVNPWSHLPCASSTVGKAQTGMYSLKSKQLTQTRETIKAIFTADWYWTLCSSGGECSVTGMAGASWAGAKLDWHMTLTSASALRVGLTALSQLKLRPGSV